MITRGNIQEATRGTRGWLVGQFPGAPIHHSTEVKIIRLPKWWRRPYVQPDGTTTLLLILSGSLIQNMREPSGETVWMHLQEGEYALWGPDIGHDSFATEDTQVVVIRWRKDSDPDTSRKA